MQLLKEIHETRETWATVEFSGTYADAKSHSAAFSMYKKTLKRTWVREKTELMSLLGNIKTKLATYHLKDYNPPKELSPPALEVEWHALLKAENTRSIKINQKIREYVLPTF